MSIAIALALLSYLERYTMYQEQIVNVPDNSVIVFQQEVYLYTNTDSDGNFPLTPDIKITNPLEVVVVLESAEEVLEYTEEY